MLFELRQGFYQSFTEVICRNICRNMLILNLAVLVGFYRFTVFCLLDWVGGYWPKQNRKRLGDVTIAIGVTNNEAFLLKGVI